jgi:nucleoid-associated protein YgaU
VPNRGTIRDANRISPGQGLTLPGDTPMHPPPRVYTVRRGDTLSGIARKQPGDANRWPEIFELNGKVISDPDRIFPGHVLVLPA